MHDNESWAATDYLAYCLTTKMGNAPSTATDYRADVSDHNSTSLSQADSDRDEKQVSHCFCCLCTMPESSLLFSMKFVGAYPNIGFCFVNCQLA